MTLTPTQASVIRDRLAVYSAWLGNRTSYRPEELPAQLAVSNEERSALEVFEWMNDPPKKYFLYIREPDPRQVLPLVGLATTWTGQRLGTVRFGRPWRSNMGDTRVPVTICGDNGRNYVGTYFKSSGDYARVRAVKGT